MLDDVSDSFLLQATVNGSDSLHSGINIADLILDDSPPKQQVSSAPNVLSQLMEGDFPLVAGQIETTDGKVLPLSIGQTDIGNGKPTPYIHISDDPSVLSRHVTITTIRTNDGKFRAMLRVNHAHGKVLLGGSIVRPDTLYPIMDDDEIIIGDGVRFKLRLNNQSPPGRKSISAPTPFYIAAPNSDELHETEEREKEEKRRQFQERLTPPNDDAIFLQLAAAVDPIPQEGLISLVHQMGDTCPYSSGRESTSQPIPPIVEQDEEESVVMASNTPIQETEHVQADEANVRTESCEEADDESIFSDEPVGDKESEQVEVQDEREDVEGQGIVNDQSDKEEDGEDCFEEHVADEAEHITEEPFIDQDDEPVTDQAEEGPDNGNIIDEEAREQKDAQQPAVLEENFSDNREDMNECGGSPMSEGTEPPSAENESPGNVQTPHAPQLSQENHEPSIVERLKVKRTISDELLQPRKRSKKTEEQIQIEQTGRGSTRSTRNSGISNGPKKLVLLKTAVEIDKQTESAVSAVGAKIETKWSDKVDALVTGSIVRTTKFLCAINRGLAIFPKSILSDIKTYKALPPVDNVDLWLQDPEGEKKYDFVLKESILRARKKPLLDGYDVYCFKNSIGEFSSDELKDLITTAGGKVVTRMPKPIPSNGQVILIGSDANAAAARSAGARSINRIEFLVDACIKQTLDFNFAQIDLAK